jgi:uncharacterized protein YndB with AHSA1/START domain
MNDKKLIIERKFNTPVQTIWKYFSDSELYKKWWGPKGFNAPVIMIDFTVGGKFLGAMHGPKGSEFDKDLWSTGIYKEIIPFKKIVITDSFADEKGNVVSGTHYGMDGMPLEMLVTFEFDEINGKTKLKLTHEGIDDIPEEHRLGIESGWNQSFDKLEKAVS